MFAANIANRWGLSNPVCHSMDLVYKMRVRVSTTFHTLLRMVMYVLNASEAHSEMDCRSREAAEQVITATSSHSQGPPEPIPDKRK